MGARKSVSGETRQRSSGVDRQSLECLHLRPMTLAAVVSLRFGRLSWSFQLYKPGQTWHWGCDRDAKWKMVLQRLSIRSNTLALWSSYRLLLPKVLQVVISPWSHDVCDCVHVLDLQYLLRRLVLVAADSPHPKA